MTDSGTPQQSPSPFHDLEPYIALPRVGGLALSPDGTRLITSVATLDPKKTRYVNALWEVDPAGQRAPRRLTRSAKGESGAAFLPDGSLAFVSGRHDPDVKDSDDDRATLWLLPAGGGESRVIVTRPGGVSGVVARDSGTIVVASATLPGGDTRDEDERRRKERKDRKISAILHETYPVRYWDHDLGPDAPRLFVGTADADHADVAAGAALLRYGPGPDARRRTGTCRRRCRLRHHARWRPDHLHLVRAGAGRRSSGRDVDRRGQRRADRPPERSGLRVRRTASRPTAARLPSS